MSDPVKLNGRATLPEVNLEGGDNSSFADVCKLSPEELEAYVLYAKDYAEYLGLRKMMRNPPSMSAGEVQRFYALRVSLHSSYGIPHKSPLFRAKQKVHATLLAIETLNTKTS